jgi:ElaB/YqjD/DUF883 family membrane-anchored ribosome-binding protein
MNAPSERIVSDVKVLVSDIEELVKATAAQTGERITAARARLQTALKGARDTVVLHTKEAAEATDRYVHENPWKAVGISAGVSAGIGLLIGLAISRH